MSPPRDIRLLLSDVDGTLVTRDKVLTPAAQAAARDLRARGIGLAVTSARPPRGLRMLVEPLGLTLPLAGFNGGALANPDMSIIERHPIDPTCARRAVDFMLAQGLDVWVYTEDAWSVPNRDGPHVEREAFILQFEPRIIRAYSDQELSETMKIVGVSDDVDLVARSETAAQAALGDSVSATRSAAYFLDVTHPHATKGYVVEAFVRSLGISPAQIATIGDMPNDVLMFNKSGFSIAMGNASDAVKAQASATTDSNEEDGFAKAVRRFLLQNDAA